MLFNEGVAPFCLRWLQLQDHAGSCSCRLLAQESIELPADGVETLLLFLGRKMSGIWTALFIHKPQEQFFANEVLHFRVGVDMGNHLTTQEPEIAHMTVYRGLGIALHQRRQEGMHALDKNHARFTFNKHLESSFTGSQLKSSR